jgi:hypothetical protein
MKFFLFIAVRGWCLEAKGRRLKRTKPYIIEK